MNQHKGPVAESACSRVERGAQSRVASSTSYGTDSANRRAVTASISWKSFRTDSPISDRLNTQQGNSSTKSLDQFRELPGEHHQQLHLNSCSISTRGLNTQQGTSSTRSLGGNAQIQRTQRTAWRASQPSAANRFELTLVCPAVWLECRAG